MKHLTQFITEYIVKKKLDKAIDSEKQYDYYPETKEELCENIQELLNNGERNFNCIDTSKITDMSELFKHEIFDKLIFDVSEWNVSNVTNMERMFLGCDNFDNNLSKWDVSNVTNMNSMFYNSKFNGDIANWDVSNVELMNYMFGYSEFNGDISNWNVSNVENMSWMFYRSKFNGDISKWDVSNVKYMKYMFRESPLEKNPPKWYKE